MQSIFHIRANTAEELRQEFIHWLDGEIERETVHFDHFCRTKGEKGLSVARRNKLAAIKSFWKDIIIDPKKD